MGQLSHSLLTVCLQNIEEKHTSVIQIQNHRQIMSTFS